MLRSLLVTIIVIAHIVVIATVGALVSGELFLWAFLACFAAVVQVVAFVNTGFGSNKLFSFGD